MFTDEQRDWVKGLISRPPAGDGPAAADVASSTSGADGPVTGTEGGTERGTERLLGLPIPIPDLGDVTDMTSTCVLDNKTAERLTLVNKSLKLDHGKLTRNPDLIIEPGGQANWAVENTKAPSWIPFLGGVSASGCEGHIQYAFPDGQSVLTCHFKATFSGNLPLLGSGNNVSEAGVDGPRKSSIEAFGGGGEGADGKYNFLVKGPGGGTGPTPNVPGTGPAASCLVTVVNATSVPIALKHQSNDVGDFMTTPDGTIAPGGSSQFAFVQTPQGKEPGCKGSCTFEAGTPTAATWRIEWTNLVGQKNLASATLDPQIAGFASLEQAGQGDENVPFTFTLSGGGGGGGIVPPKPTEDPPFLQPPTSKQPTLRKGDKSPDGWVEYLQEALNTSGPVKLTVDGNFDANTLKAVLAFQKAKGLQVDGTVGNQTWAALREGTPQVPSTDGRKPHSFKQEGKQARFFTEKHPVAYLAQGDVLTFQIVSTGEDTKLDGRKVTVRLTPPGSKPRVTEVVIPAGTPLGTTDQGSSYFAELTKMTASFPSTPPGAPGTEYLIEAYLDQDLGGDRFSGKPTTPA